MMAADVRKPEGWPSPVALLFLYLLWILLENYILGPYSVIPLFDTTPFMDYFSFSDRWNPLNISGIPRLSSSLDQFFFGFSVLPFWLSYALTKAMQYGAALYCTYLVGLRLKLDPMGSALGALLFTSYLQMPEMLWGYAIFLPLLLLGFGHIQRMTSWPLQILSTLSFGAVMGLLTNPGLENQALFLAFFWFLIVEREKGWRIWVLFLLMSVMVFVVRLPDYFDLVLNSQDSFRKSVSEQYVYYSFLKSISTDLFLVSHVAVGVVILSVLGLRLFRTSPVFKRVVASLLSVFVVIVLLELIQPDMPKSLDFVRSFRFYFMLFPFFFLLSVCAAAAYDNLPDPVFKLKWIGLDIPKALVLMVCLFFIFLKTLGAKSDIPWRLNLTGSAVTRFEDPGVLALAQENVDRSQHPFRVSNSNWIIHDDMQALKLETAGGTALMHSQAILELWWRADRDLKERGIGATLNLDLDGDLRQSEGVDFSQRYRLPIFSLLNIKYFISLTPLHHPDLLMRSGQDVESIMRGTTPASWRHNLHRAFSRSPHFFIAENKSVLPRFRLVDHVRTFPDAKSLLDALEGMSVDELRREVLLDGSNKYVSQAVLQELQKTHFDVQGGEVTIVKRASDRTVLHVRSGGPGILVWSQAYNRFWVASIDGNRAPVFPVYHALTGLIIPANAREVILQFDPPYKWSNLVKFAKWP
ncbi:MAG: hypothetical protein HQL63_06620 [Magnetococcales bacterium]|nr:hypothetical protein [Magnetococcales bacterium]MBF0321838.1 hypothetical protein [Magnetococcales bacterium]